MRIARYRRVFAAAVTTAAAMLALIDIPASAQPADLAAPTAANTDTTALAQLAEDYLQQRADMLTTSRPGVRPTVVHARHGRSHAG
ncbi:hypothetical protein [Streptomyces sp. NPDC001137]|uniref:hypothetical protein n=1 Tax=Streptomyces sp. NPDC001137 TaxID=3154378 RepID=UPI00332D7CEE